MKYEKYMLQIKLNIVLINVIDIQIQHNLRDTIYIYDLFIYNIIYQLKFIYPYIAKNCSVTVH